jgi:hypothetical protein
MSDELENMWRKGSRGLFQALCKRMSGRAELKHARAQSE